MHFFDRKALDLTRSGLLKLGLAYFNVADTLERRHRLIKLDKVVFEIFIGVCNTVFRNKIGVEIACGIYTQTLCIGVNDCFLYIWYTVAEHHLQLLGRDILAVAENYEIFNSARECDELMSVDFTNVTGIEPAVCRKHLLSTFAVLVVAHHDVVALYHYGALSSFVAAVDPDFTAGYDLADRAGTLISAEVCRYERTALGNSVTVYHSNTDAVKELSGLLVKRGAAGDNLAHIVTEKA